VRRLLRGLTAASLLSLAIVPAAYAHSGIEVGDYLLDIGWKVEPAFVGQPNAVQVTVLSHDETPILDLGPEGLQVVVSTAGQDSPSLQLTAAFDAAEPTDITASIPELRLSGGPAAPKTIETKFGAMLVEPFTDDAPGGARSCLRFARNFDEPRLELSGWFCNAGAELVDRGMIACALDRLSLLAAGSEPKLAALFARAELRRSFCGQRSVFLAATPKRIDWIEAVRDPKLRRSAEF